MLSAERMLWVITLTEKRKGAFALIRTTPNCRLLIEECSIHLGQYPSKLKFAKVVPVFKEGDGTVPNNCIPVSLIQF